MPRVLVVDDDKPIRNLVATVVERRGLKVDTAADGVTALKLIADTEYDVAIVDLMMPEMNGIELLDHLKRVTHHPHTIIVLTASGPGDIRQLDATAVHAIMRKPFDINELADVVEAAATAADRQTSDGATRSGEANVLLFPPAEQQR